MGNKPRVAGEAVGGEADIYANHRMMSKDDSFLSDKRNSTDMTHPFEKVLQRGASQKHMPRVSPLELPEHGLRVNLKDSRSRALQVMPGHHNNQRSSHHHFGAPPSRTTTSSSVAKKKKMRHRSVPSLKKSASSRYRHNNNSNSSNKMKDVFRSSNPSSASSYTSTSNPSSPRTGESTNSENEMVDEICAATPKKVCSADFETLCVIGQGSFGKVMQVRHRESGKIYAMKVMRKDNIIAKNQVTHTRHEKSILQKIKHPFIVNLNFAFQSREKLYLVLDYINGGELFFHLKRAGKFPERLVAFYAAEISCALIHLHSNGILYRDLKPENLLLSSEGHIVITDFGLSKEIKKDEHTKTFCGSQEYLAPEVLKGEPHSFPVDWWSLGTLLFEMLAGLPPFFAEDVHEMYQGIVSGDLVFPHEISDNACDFIFRLLDKNPAKRLGGEVVKSHPWFRGVDWIKLEQKKIRPPWRPPVKNKEETSQIDEEFLRMDPIDTPVFALDLTQVVPDDLFVGFTYEGRLDGESMDESTPKSSGRTEARFNRLNLTAVANAYRNQYSQRDPGPYRSYNTYTEPDANYIQQDLDPRQYQPAPTHVRAFQGQMVDANGYGQNQNAHIYANQNNHVYASQNNMYANQNSHMYANQVTYSQPYHHSNSEHYKYTQPSYDPDVQPLAYTHQHANSMHPYVYTHST